MLNRLTYRHFLSVTALAGIGLIAATQHASSQPSQTVQPPVARYAMDVGTVSGMGAMGGSMGAGLGMMFGGGGSKEAHELILRLGSSGTPTKGGPKAEHFMPSGAKLSKSVPLVTPKAAPRDDAMPEDMQKPKGRLLIYWGCGPKAPKGQPVVIDFAKVAKGQFPPGLFSTSVPTDRGPTFGNSKTYGDWPNGKDRKMLSGSSSILDNHRIAGNYSPEIAFALTQDFMPAITGRATSSAMGGTTLRWNTVTGATGYYAWVMGFQPDESGEPRDMVWWSSSASQQFGGGLWDWLSPATVTKLINQKVVMPPTQTSCVLPAEVKQAGGDFMMGNLYAYGPEANFAYPPRPADPKLAWKPEWTARVRYRSHTMWMLTQPDMGAMMRGAQ